MSVSIVFRDETESAVPLSWARDRSADGWVPFNRWLDAFVLISFSAMEVTMRNFD